MLGIPTDGIDLRFQKNADGRSIFELCGFEEDQFGHLCRAAEQPELCSTSSSLFKELISLERVTDLYLFGLQAKKEEYFLDGDKEQVSLVCLLDEANCFGPRVHASWGFAATQIR